MSTELVNLLKNTFNPSLIDSAQRALSNARSNQGFATDLMVISDDANIEINVRQSALVLLKNLFYDECTQGNTMNRNDYEIIKQNILEALIRSWGQKQLTPTLREIIHLIAEKDYPDRWPEIVDCAVNNINNPSDFNTVASSVEALKAIMSVCGSSITHEITLSNLCNKIVFPLFELANKLFQNFSPETLSILVSIFKIFSLAIFYHLPPIFVNNIHSLMVFIKKILEIQQMRDILPLKTVCLKILSRLYIRHTSSKTVSYRLLSFAQNFHQKYSCPIVQTLICQLADPNNQQQILNLSLNCLTNIYRNDYNQNSVNLISRYTKKIIQICLARFQISGTSKKIKQSIGSYITCIKEQRNSLIDFISAVISEDTSLLGEFINSLTNGDQNVQELSLYIFSALAVDIEDIPDLHQNMCQFIINYIMPILANSSSSLMLKARGCQIISNYIYIDLPEEHLKDIFHFTYNCLTEIKEIYLNIYAMEAFTKLIIKYEQFVQFIIPCLETILKKYTQLMKESNGEVQEIIKNFENFIGEIDGKDLEPYAVNLVKFLLELYYEYENQSRNNLQQGGNKNDSSSEDDDEQDNILVNASRGCLACIRKIFSAQNLSLNVFQELGEQCIFPLIVDTFSDKQLLHFEEALNLLNLYLYKSYKFSYNLSEKYVRLFPIFIYSLLGIPQGLLQMTHVSNSYKTMVANICSEPDEDIVVNVIGVLRNYIAKLGGQLSSLTNEVNSSYIQEIFKVVRHIHTAFNQQKNDFCFKKSDRYVILTLYTTLLQHQVTNQAQTSEILKDFVDWTQRVQKPDNIPYLENILIAINFYGGFVFQKIVNCQWLVRELTNCAHLFLYEYQLQRLIIGIAKMLMIGIFSNTSIDLLRLLPDIVGRFQSLKNKDNGIDLANKLIDEEEEAIEDLVADNTHLGLLPQRSQEDEEKKNEIYEKICEDIEWDEQYNKYYFSPLEDINQIQMLAAAYQNSEYTNLLSPQDNSQLNSIFANSGRFL